MNKLFGNSTNSAKSTSNTSTDLTEEDLQEAIRLLEEAKAVYYGTDEHMEVGVVYCIKETEAHPRFFVCHPDDLEEIKNQLRERYPQHRLKHLGGMSEKTSLRWASNALRSQLYHPLNYQSLYSTSA